MTSGSYYSSPSGREILSAKLDAIVNDHNQQVEEEAKVLDDKKMAIMETARSMINKLEEASHQRQLRRLVKMKEITEKINQELQTINEEEEQLKQFSEALIKLGNEIKTTIILIVISFITSVLSLILGL